MTLSKHSSAAGWKKQNKTIKTIQSRLDEQRTLDRRNVLRETSGETDMGACPRL